MTDGTLSPSSGGPMRGQKNASPPDLQEIALQKETRFKTRFLAVFMICLLIPGSLFLGGARLTPYRLFLLVVFVPLFWQYITGRAGRLGIVDYLILFYASWFGVSTLVAYGIGRIDFIVISVIEVLCGYLVGRVLVRSAADYRVFMKCFLWGLLILAPFAALEMLTKINLISEIAGKFLQPYEQAIHEPRLGFYRAQTSFEHPILFGLFCALGVANVIYLFRNRFVPRMFWLGVVLFTCFSALSSGPWLAVGVQFIMVGWERTMKNLPAKWLVLGAGAAFIFLILQLITPNGAVEFIASNLTLVPATAEYRILTFQYASQSVFEHPFFGVGQGISWERPWWHTGSIDNYWLSTAVTYGLPATLSLLLALGVHLGKVMTRTGLDTDENACRSGHFMAMVGLIVTLATVHLWSAPGVFVMAYIGAGVWLYTPKKPILRRRARRIRTEADPVGPPVSPPPHAPSPASKPAPKRTRPAIPGRGHVRGSTGRYGGGSD